MSLLEYLRIRKNILFGDPNATALPETEKICKEVLSLPIYPELTDEEIDFVADAVRKFYAS